VLGDFAFFIEFLGALRMNLQSVSAHSYYQNKAFWSLLSFFTRAILIFFVFGKSWLSIGYLCLLILNWYTYTYAFFSNVAPLGFALSYFIIIGSSHLIFELWCLLVQSKLGLDESTTRQAMQLLNETKDIVVSSMASSVSGSVRLHIYSPYFLYWTVTYS
jgi:hypothetical protein